MILETGFGLGLNFLATWAAWRRDAARCARLHYVAIDKHPPTRADLGRAHAAVLGGESGDEAGRTASLAAHLRDAWPPLTGDLHRLAFDGEQVELLLAFGDAAAWLRRLRLAADAIYLDGFAPERNAEMWSEDLFAALPPLSAPNATAATWSVARPVRDGLARHGFEVGRAPGYAGKREMTVARFAPRHRPAPTARQQAALPAARDALVIGAGLAGAAAARALAARGLKVTVLEAAPAAACGASGNPAGLVRSLVARDDGAHSRWHRAAALQARRDIAPLIEPGSRGMYGSSTSVGEADHSPQGVPSLVPGRLDGVLHLADDIEEMQQRLQAAAWPSDLVQALDKEAAASVAGIAGVGPAWFFPGGGWVDPSALVRASLGQGAGPSKESGRLETGTSSGGLTGGISLRTACRVASLVHRGARWQACDEQGRPWAEADLVVLANADDAIRLVPRSPDGAPAAGWRLGRSRGQVTHLPPGALPEGSRPRLPVARNGYVIPLPDGSLLCGATQSSGDDEAALRAVDHAHNLAVLARLTGASRTVPDLGALSGRVGWRCHTDDRLPLVGAVPVGSDSPELRTAARLTQPQHVTREPGLFVLTALGSRGITSAALGAHLLAAWICGTPMPVDADLLDAVDPARYRSREARSGRAAPSPRGQ